MDDIQITKYCGSGGGASVGYLTTRGENNEHSLFKGHLLSRNHKL